MKVFKIIGLFFLFSFTFFYTDKVLEVSMEQDDIMIKIKENSKKYNIEPKNAKINSDTIIPGQKGKYINNIESYKAMKKLGYYDKSFLIYDDIYPEISIHNNNNLYIINGNTLYKEISLIYIVKNDKTLPSIITITNKYNIPLNIFIDSNFLNNNISIIDKIKKHEIYSYGTNGKYTQDNLIISNNIINNKANNKAIFCLFIEKDKKNIEKCANNRMLSLYVDNISNTNSIKNNLANGKFFLLDNTKELSSSIEYILKKGYNIVPLSKLIRE